MSAGPLTRSRTQGLVGIKRGREGQHTASDVVYASVGVFSRPHALVFDLRAAGGVHAACAFLRMPEEDSVRICAVVSL